MQKKAPSFAGRAVLALVLLVAFYVLALGMAGLLLYIPFAELTVGDRIDLRLTLFCLIGGFVIVRAVLPRRDRFAPPWPALTEGDQPRLFAAIRGVARATEQAMPAEVYLIPEVNAWVAQRGGVMGVGSRRVMGIGLPLMHVLGVDQFRAVLAHEFGHYHGGDTALGPLVYRTRAAMQRTLADLRRHSSTLALPFELYGKLFLRVTHAVSRRQEYTADALAAHTVGTAPMVEGLRRIHVAGHAFDAFWENEFSPALNGGVRPPLVDGYARFMASDRIAPGMDAALRKALAEGKSDPYDTHPSLRERIAALSTVSAAGRAEDEEPAISLLDNVEALEDALVASLLKPGAREKIRPGSWDEMVGRVWLPTWRQRAEAFRERLRGCTPASLAECAGRPRELPVRLRITAPGTAVEADVRNAAFALSATLAVALQARGWTLHAPPGDDVTAERGDSVLRPFTLVNRLLDGGISADEWTRTWQDAGIADLDLSRAAEPDDSRVAAS